MRARLHRFLLLFLMLALPLQAFASAAMLGCTFSHQPAMAEMAMADDAMTGCHESEPAHPPASHDCKHCAACALGSVLPIPIVGTVSLPAMTAGFPVHSAVAFDGYLPEGPERPPRAFLA